MFSEPTHPRSSHEQRVAYALLRLLLGVNFFGHGAVRILHGPGVFAAGMVKQMAETPLPPAFVSAFGYAVPFLELTLGTLLILGLLTRWSLTLGMLFLTALMVGVTLRQDWATAGVQLGYGLVLFALLFLRESSDSSWLRLLPTDPRGDDLQ